MADDRLHVHIEVIDGRVISQKQTIPLTTDEQIDHDQRKADHTQERLDYENTVKDMTLSQKRRYNLRRTKEQAYSAGNSQETEVLVPYELEIKKEVEWESAARAQVRDEGIRRWVNDEMNNKFDEPPIEPT